MKLIQVIRSRGGTCRYFFVNIDGDGIATGMVVIEDAHYIRSDGNDSGTPRTFVDPDGGPFIGPGFTFGGENGSAQYRVSGQITRVMASTYTFPVTQF